MPGRQAPVQARNGQMSVLRGQPHRVRQEEQAQEGGSQEERMNFNIRRAARGISGRPGCHHRHQSPIVTQSRNNSVTSQLAEPRGPAPGPFHHLRTDGNPGSHLPEAVPTGPGRLRLARPNQRLRACEKNMNIKYLPRNRPRSPSAAIVGV